MNTLQIREIFVKDRKTSKDFVDVFALDHFLSYSLHDDRDAMFVVNNEISTMTGNHWVLVYKRDDVCYFCDSFARPLMFYGLEEKLKTYGKEMIQVPYQLQCTDSNLCGAYVIFFGYMLARDKPFESIMNYFSRNCKFNDTLVWYFLKHLLFV